LHRAGAKSRLSGITAGLFCCLVFLFGMPLLSYLPKPVLAGFLLYIGMDLLIEWTGRAWFKLPKSDCFIIVLIAVVIGSVGFVEGILAGMMASVGLFVFNYSRIGVIQHEFSGRVGQSNVVRTEHQHTFLRSKGEQIYIIRLQNVIFFGTAHTLITKIRKYVETSGPQAIRFIILDFKLVSGLDSSTVLSFIKLRQIAEAHGISLLFTALKPPFKHALIQGGIFNPKDEVVKFIPDLDRSLEWCEERILRRLSAEERTSPATTRRVESIFGDPGETDTFISFCKRYRHPEGYVLFREGDPPDGLYFLESGQVSVRKLFSDRTTMRLRTYKDGTILGEMGLYSNAPRSAFVIVDTQSYLYFLSKKAFGRMEKEAPALALKLHKYTVNLIASRLKHSQEQSLNLI
jgi:SulP family sulfate permease